MKRFEMTREYWINEEHYTVCKSVKFDNKPTLFELRSDAKLGFLLFNSQGYEISAFSVTLYEVTDSPNRNGQVSRPVLTLVYMKNGRYKICMNQTSEDIPPFNPY